jgi:histidine triad (HIT) family protein
MDSDNGGILEGCIFCDRKRMEREGIVYEDGLCFAIINKYPASKAHLLVISKAHYEDLLSTDDKILDRCFEVAKMLSARIKERMRPTGIKMIVNMDGEEELAHMHIHLIPVYNRREPRLDISYKKRRKITEKERKELLVKLASAKPEGKRERA